MSECADSTQPVVDSIYIYRGPQWKWDFLNIRNLVFQFSTYHFYILYKLCLNFGSNNSETTIRLSSSYDELTGLKLKCPRVVLNIFVTFKKQIKTGCILHFIFTNLQKLSAVEESVRFLQIVLSSFTINI